MSLYVIIFKSWQHGRHKALGPGHPVQVQGSFVHDSATGQSGPWLTILWPSRGRGSSTALVVYTTETGRKLAEASRAACGKHLVSACSASPRGGQQGHTPLCSVSPRGGQQGHTPTVAALPRSVDSKHQHKGVFSAAQCPRQGPGLGLRVGSWRRELRTPWVPAHRNTPATPVENPAVHACPGPSC